MPSKRRLSDKEKARKRQALLDYTEQYFNECAKIMRLGYYVIEVASEIGEGSYMELNFAPNQLAVDVVIGDKFLELDADAKRQTVGHELSHFHLRKITDVVEDMFQDYVPKVSWDSLWTQVVAAEEQTADELGHIAASLLPKWNPPSGLE